ncbi:MAG: tRNA pseudouridine(38-40) synthase TruA [Bacilli bacterium]|jgi:tRNA pseudouridine38-40 synthase
MEELRKVKCVISYDGSSFNGFQSQKDVRNIQDEIELALTTIHKEEQRLVASGRTDRGVHAYGQVISFVTKLNLSEKQWCRALNSLLPSDIHVLKVEFVATDFHARLSAKAKTYCYYLNMKEYNPLERNYVYQYNKHLYLEPMIKAAQLFVGKHDFRNFCSNSASEVISFERFIYSFTISEVDGLLLFRVKGSGFLRYMVRMLVGTLIAIGAKKEKEKYILERLDKQENMVTIYNAPSMGLYLEEVEY